MSDTVLEVQKGTIDINLIFKHIDKNLGLAKEQQEGKEDGKNS
jgi:hypothetical protein